MSFHQASSSMLICTMTLGCSSGASHDAKSLKLSSCVVTHQWGLLVKNNLGWWSKHLDPTGEKTLEELFRFLAFWNWAGLEACGFIHDQQVGGAVEHKEIQLDRVVEHCWSSSTYLRSIWQAYELPAYHTSSNCFGCQSQNFLWLTGSSEQVGEIHHRCVPKSFM